MAKVQSPGTSMTMATEIILNLFGGRKINQKSKGLSFGKISTTKSKKRLTLSRTELKWTP